MKIKIKKLHKDAIVPRYAYSDDAAMDLYSIEDVLLKPGEHKTVCTGIATEFPPDYAALIWGKSGLASKKGIGTLAGVIDCGYRGEWKVVVFNFSNEDYLVKKGEKIAQFLIQPVAHMEVEEANELSESVRGTKSFGSSGLK